MRSVSEIIVVEGRYDKNAVSQIVDATVIETSGFAVFNDGEKVALLRRLAEKRGLIILTDSDGAGFLIRGRLKSMLGTANVRHAYIPDIPGREKRKRAGSKEGKLGVEGMSRDVILAALERAGATFSEMDAAGGSEAKKDPITKADLYAAGLSGGLDSAARRAALLKKLGLPERLSANGLLDVLNALYTREEFISITV
jgi:ribonuclease M5